MNLIDKLRAKAKAAVERQRELNELAASEDRDFTEAEGAEFDALQAEIEKTLAGITRLEKAETSAASVSRSVAHTDVTGNLDAVTRVVAPRSSIVRVNDDLTGSQIVGICAWAAAKNKHYPKRSAIEHVADAGFQVIADECVRTQRALVENKAFQSITVGGGDNTITVPLSTDFIEFLRNESAFLAGGPLQIDLSFGKLDIPGGNVGTSGSYTAEGADIGYVQATTRKVSLSAKHLSAVTAISNYNIEISPLAIASILGDDLAQGMTLSIDAAGLRGDGTGDNPAGILTLVHASHKFAVSVATTASPTIAQIDSEAKLILSKIRATNIPKRRRRWIMSNRTFTYLQFLRNTDGTWAYPGLHLASPTWHDNIPVTISEQAPSNLGVGTNESEIYLVDFGHVLMGVARALTLKSSQEASYKDGGGTLVSAFSRDETVIRAMASHDFDMRHTKAALVLTGVLWGS